MYETVVSIVVMTLSIATMCFSFYILYLSDQDLKESTAMLEKAKKELADVECRWEQIKKKVENL